MEIIQRVLVKQVITEKSKAKLAQSFHYEKNQLDRECQQLLFEKRKLSNKLGASRQELLERFEAEVEKRKEKIEMIDFKLTQLTELQLGQEIVEKELQRLIDVKVGDDWEAINQLCAIIIQDGVVIRIDEP